MPLAKGSQHYPTNQREWDAWSRNVPVTPDPASVGTIELKDGQVTYSKFQTIAPVTIVGNLNATAQAPGPITAGADNRFLARRSGLLTFDVLADVDIPSTLARDTEVTAAITAALASYVTQTAGDARYVQLANVLNASKTFDPPSCPTSTQTSTTVTCTGAVVGDFAHASFSVNLAGMIVTASVDVADTVSVIFLNMTGSTIDLASGTLRVRVWKQ